MSKFEFPQSIRSRPVYGTLEPRAGTAHLFIADAEGAEAILGMATPDIMAHAHIIYIPKGTDFEPPPAVSTRRWRMPRWACRSIWRAPKG